MLYAIRLRVCIILGKKNKTRKQHTSTKIYVRVADKDAGLAAELRLNFRDSLRREEGMLYAVRLVVCIILGKKKKPRKQHKSTKTYVRVSEKDDSLAAELRLNFGDSLRREEGMLYAIRLRVCIILGKKKKTRKQHTSTKSYVRAAEKDDSLAAELRLNFRDSLRRTEGMLYAVRLVVCIILGKKRRM